MGLRGKMKVLTLFWMIFFMQTEKKKKKHTVCHTWKLKKRAQRASCQSEGGEKRERGTEILGLFEALPTL